MKLSLAAYAGDQRGLSEAVEAGADTTKTDNDLLKQYQQQFLEYKTRMFIQFVLYLVEQKNIRNDVFLNQYYALIKDSGNNGNKARPEKSQDAITQQYAGQWKEFLARVIK